MARPLAPCGTPAAYRRHCRRGEPVDDACASAARDQKNARMVAKRDAAASVVRLAIAESVSASGDVSSIDELEDARANLRIVSAAMEAGVPSGLAALSKQRMELVAVVKRLEAASRPKESKLDELARRRASRLAASAN